MKCRIILAGVLWCLAARAAGPQQALTGCIDEQNGQYVLLDDQMAKITSLQAVGSDKELFAKYLGHKVQVRGTKSTGDKSTFRVATIGAVAGTCGPAGKQ